MLGFVRNLLTPSSKLTDVLSQDAKSTEEGSQPSTLEFRVSLFKIDGSDVELLRSHSVLRFTSDALLILEEEGKDIIYQAMYRDLCALRQHSPVTAQFLWRSNRKETLELGAQFVSPEAAYDFRDELLAALLETCEKLQASAVSVALLRPEQKIFEPWIDKAQMLICRRKADGFAGFTLAQNEWIVFQSELSQEIQFWPTPDTKEFTMWGPYIRKSDTELVRSFLLFKVEEHSDTTMEIFKILDKLIGYEQKLVQNADFDMGSVMTAETAEDRATWAHEDSDESEDRSLARDLSDDEKEITKPQPKRTSIVNDPSSQIIGKNPSAKLHRFMQVGDKYSFVCRSNDLGKEAMIYNESKLADFDLHVYGREKGALSDVTKIAGDKFKYEQRKVKPAKALLHAEEGKLLMIDDEDRHAVYYMDLEAEKIVSRFDTGGLQASLVFSSHKNAAKSLDPTFTCANPRALYTMDTRLKKGRSHTLEYKTNPQFSAAATDAKGHILLGSRSGTLRLYDGDPNSQGDIKIAKTQLESINEPIKSVDVTKDGSWILATTRNCLILFNTKLKATGKTGFEARLGKNKPPGIYLKLSDKVIKHYNLSNIDLAPAVFDEVNHNILSSTGNLAVIWDFIAIKKGQWPVEAQIRLTDAYIKDTNVLSDGSVVVAYPQNLDVLGVKRQ